MNLLILLKKRDVKNGIEIVTLLSKEGVDFKLFTEELINRLHEDLLSKINGSKTGLNLSEIKDLIEMLVRVHTSIKYAILPQLPLELTIVEWAAASTSNVASASAVSQSLGSESSGVSSSSDQKIEQAVQTKKPSVTTSENDKILKDLIEKVKSENFSIAGVLRGCKVEKWSDKELELSTGFKFHKERLNDKKVLEMLEKLSSEIAGKEIKVTIKLKE